MSNQRAPLSEREIEIIQGMFIYDGKSRIQNTDLVFIFEELRAARAVVEWAKEVVKNRTIKNLGFVCVDNLEEFLKEGGYIRE